eukprot:TRINITY_DN63133_c0_g1_i1.p1 TRINITY_DN63133_c0_g1~~TRINITY_DN63133_c0_g1_i1.p1  ORF type:complete len:273 (+),score=32.27 TRINITY_DN63133_c0_g1_i1:71-889(+)
MQASPVANPWWKEPDSVESVSFPAVLEFCQTESLADVRCRRAGVVRGALAEDWLGWNGRVAMLSTGSTLSFFPSAHEGHNAFSRERHRAEVATIQPSLGFWAWITSAKHSPWQLRGLIVVEPADLAHLLGSSVQQAADDSIIKITQTSLWAGAGGTRTPLHVDKVHALIYQIEGSKRFFLSSRQDVEAAVFNGTLPEAVRDDGGTDAFCLDGSLDEVHGLSEASPPRAKGSFVTLCRGDCLILPAGLFHDVESAPGAPASLSLTIRFELGVA